MRRSCLAAVVLVLAIPATGTTGVASDGSQALSAGPAEVAGSCSTRGRTGTIEIMTWVAPYAIDECRAVVEADFGECDAEDGLTRVGLQFWIPNWDGTISYQNLGPRGNPNDADVTWWRDWCTANGIECLLCIYNNDGSTWDWDLAKAGFADNRATFVAALVAEMERHNLDGIDLDLEGIGNLNGDRAAFDQFVHDLWVELDARGKILTIDTFHYIWNAPNHDWWSDWLGEVDNIHAMGYDDLYEGGTGYHQYSFQQDAGCAAGYPGTAVLMGVPGWLASWGTSAGYGTSAQAHVQEVRYLLTEPTGIAIWDLQLQAWRDSDLWCEIVALRESGPANPPVAAFSGTPTSGDAPLTVTFADESTNDPTSWSWDFGDDTTSEDQSPLHTYTSDGSYTVSLTAANDAGSDTETKTAYITVGDGLFCYWALDEGSGDVAYDSAGGNDGTLNGPTWVSGQIGHGLSFDGLDDYVEIGATDLGGSWTAAMWVNRSADRSASALMGSSAGALKLEQWPDTHQVGITDYPGGDYSFAYSTPIGKWVHLAFACDGTKTLLYVNGALSDSVTAAIAMPLGRIGDGVAYADPPAASLDEVRVYGRALDVAEIHALWEGATGVADVGDDPAVSGRPVLLQNYPNPFNPTTTFAYTLPTDCRVELSIHNVRGQRVASLVNEIQTAGRKTVVWDADGYPSGIYFYRLTVGEDVLTEQAVLLK